MEDALPNTKQRSSDKIGMRTSKLAAPSKKSILMILARIYLGWRRCSKAVKRMWRKSWTTETFSFALSILTLAGLVTTLLAHQGKPFPEWPQLVSINSLVSLFSLLLRICVSVILTEGMSQSYRLREPKLTSAVGISQCKWNWYRKSKRLDHIERLDSASRGSWGSIN